MVRTRFAPSPTGDLHIGGARTALYCWLYAHKMHGTFILRIEDTDLERSTQASMQAILDSMAWLNLNYSEGPFYQTARFPRYHQAAQLLLAEDKAYRCYCSKERLEKLREEQLAKKEKPRYDGFCRDRKEPGEGPFVIRFKNPVDGVVEFDDLVRGKLVFANAELDDLIIVRSDGSPTYNFTVVVDDWDMTITHVIRGDDHINNTPRQINILRAFGATPPQYAHVPMILGRDGKRLSKRHGATSVLQYRDEGFLPEALLNYLARLGWSHGDQEIFSIEELIKFFDLKGLNRAPAAFDPDKLLWLNQHYLKTSEPTRIVEALEWYMERLKVHTDNGPELIEVVKAQRERVKTLVEMAERSRYFYEDVVMADDMKGHFTPEIKPVLAVVRDRLKALGDWNKEAIHDVLATTADAQGVKLGKLAQPIRVAVTGGTVSPPIDQTLVLIGKERSIERLNKVL